MYYGISVGSILEKIDHVISIFIFQMQYKDRSKAKEVYYAALQHCPHSKVCYTRWEAHISMDQCHISVDQCKTGNSSVLTVVLPQSCAKPLICWGGGLKFNIIANALQISLNVFLKEKLAFCFRFHWSLFIIAPDKLLLSQVTARPRTSI